MKYLFSCIKLWVLLTALPVAAQQVKITASVSRQQILIGEPFQLTFRVQMPEGYRAGWFTTDTFPHFEIQHRSAIDTLRSGGQQILVQNIRITSWDSGRWSLPSFTLSRANRTRPIPITVNFSPMDPAQPYHEVKDVQEVERPGYQNWWWYLVGLALLLFFLLLLFPSKKKKAPAEAVAPEGAYRAAMRQLDALNKRSGDMPAKEFYTQLIGILRTYLLHRKEYQSPSKTTADIQEQLPKWGLGSAEGARLMDTLQLSDGVKFARFEASAAERKTSVDNIREAIVQMEKKMMKTY